jgi:hypothetical protein
MYLSFYDKLILSWFNYQVGSATWVGVGYMFFLVPTTAMVVVAVKKARREGIRFSDLRVRMMSELLMGIRIVKFYKHGNVPLVVRWPSFVKRN